MPALDHGHHLPAVVQDGPAARVDEELAALGLLDLVRDVVPGDGA